MKTKPLLGLVAIVAVTGFAASAQAGWSVGVSIAAPVRYVSQVQVAAPCYTAPVAYCPPPVVYDQPRYERHYDYRNYRGHDRDRYEHGRGHDDHGRGYGGHR